STAAWNATSQTTATASRSGGTSTARSAKLALATTAEDGRAARRGATAAHRARAASKPSPVTAVNGRPSTCRRRRAISAASIGPITSIHFPRRGLDDEAQALPRATLSAREQSCPRARTMRSRARAWTILGALGPLVAYGGLVCWLTWPLAASAAASLPFMAFFCQYDILYSAWVLAHESHALATAPATFPHANIYHPAPGALFYGPAGPGAPLWMQ